MSEATTKPKWENVTTDRLKDAIDNTNEMIALLKTQSALYSKMRDAMQCELEKRGKKK